MGLFSENARGAPEALGEAEEIELSRLLIVMKTCFRKRPHP
jgi:hypothetical protein